MTYLGWDDLPDEILLHIFNCKAHEIVALVPNNVRLRVLTEQHTVLDPRNVSQLQLVSRKLRKFCLDDELWKRYCFDRSAWYQALSNRRTISQRSPFHSLLAADDSETADQTASQDTSADTSDRCQDHGFRSLNRAKAQRVQDMANWDPVFPSEHVTWLDEYIHREGPASINWLQAPRIAERGAEAIIESHGVALYSPFNGGDGDGTMLAVSPLEDRSICLWDVKGTRGRRGAILHKSEPDILIIDGPGDQNNRRSKMLDSSIADRISVDNHNHKAYIAVQSRRSYCLTMALVRTHTYRSQT